MSQALYQRAGALRTHVASVLSVRALADLSEADRALFKAAKDSTHVLTCEETIFHAQGGGQPSDVGSMSIEHADAAATKGKEEEAPAVFDVQLVRSSAVSRGAHLHAGVFQPAVSIPSGFVANARVTQKIDGEKRDLYSRIHTAGHLIGLAVRKLAESGELKNVSDQGKAQHYPGSAFVECEGLIGGEWKDRLQQEANDLVKRNLSVDICYWNRQECEEHRVDAPEGYWESDEDVKPGEQKTLRVVDVEASGAYYCGGTHLPKTSDIGEIVIRKISRQKGISKISYEIRPM